MTNRQKSIGQIFNVADESGVFGTGQIVKFGLQGCVLEWSKFVKLLKRGLGRQLGIAGALAHKFGDQRLVFVERRARGHGA